MPSSSFSSNSPGARVVVTQEELELVQLVPPIEKGCWPAVMRFATRVLTMNATLEDDVDIVSLN